MLNPDAEIYRLRSYLSMKGLDQADIDTVSDSAANDINEAILHVVSEGMMEAVEHAISIGADEFVEDVDVYNSGGAYYVTTRSGKTDFSTQEVKNLPNLLKNSKQAADGSRYKVVPVGSGSGKSTMGKSIFEDQRELQNRLQEVRASIRERLDLNVSERSDRMVSRFKDMVRQNMPARKQFYQLPNIHSGVKPEFRTASSKQDPETKWVIPAKNMDMTDYLMSLNSKIQDDIQTIVLRIIDEYEGLF